MNTLIQLLGSIVIALTLSACSNLGLSGKVSGDDRGAKNEVEISTQLCPNIKGKSKISNPYSFSDPRFETPKYTETSIEISF
jgi:hypothetical protein